MTIDDLMYAGKAPAILLQNKMGNTVVCHPERFYAKDLSTYHPGFNPGSSVFKSEKSSVGALLRSEKLVNEKS